MSLEDAFLRAILTAPDSDACRLSYADWLEERGNPRGEFIRVQCEIARTRNILLLGQVDQNHVELLFEREKKLLDSHKEQWLLETFDRDLCKLIRRLENFDSGGVEDRFGAAEIEFSRGFPERLLVDARLFNSVFAKDIFNILHHSFLNSLTIRDFEGAHLQGQFLINFCDSVFEHQELSSIRRLELHGQHLALGGYRSLLRTANLKSIVHLGLGATGMTDQCLIELISSPLFVQLRALEIDSNPLTMRSLQALIDSPHFHELKLIDLRRTRPDRSKFFTALEDIISFRFPDAESEDLLEVLNRNGILIER